MTTGSTNLAHMLSTLEVQARPETYVYAVLPSEHLAVALAHATVREAEGLTVILTKEDAVGHGVTYEFEAAWLTLSVHSSLEAVGLTAAFSNALSNAEISCNVLAGFYHDHLLVPVADKERALAVLAQLRE